MTNQLTPETDAMLVSDPHPPSDWLVFARVLEIERNAARADTARLRAALEGIVEYGKMCNPGTATDCARLIYLAEQALNTPAQ
jgi:hypothetical protein